MPCRGGIGIASQIVQTLGPWVKGSAALVACQRDVIAAWMGGIAVLVRQDLTIQACPSEWPTGQGPRRPLEARGEQANTSLVVQPNQLVPHNSRNVREIVYLCKKYTARDAV